MKRLLTLLLVVCLTAGLSAVPLQIDASAASSSYSWVKTTRSATSSDLRGIVWDGKRFVAVGEDGIAAISSDGIMWAAYASGSNDYLNSIVWNGNTYVAVGDHGIILTSSDGKKWTARNSGTSLRLEGIAWNGSIYVVTGEFGTILTSVDGITWGKSQSSWYYNILWDGKKFVAAGKNGITATSVDAETWTEVRTGVNSDLNCIAYNKKGLYVVVGDKGVILTSTDCKKWVSRTSGIKDDYFTGVIWNGSQFVAVGSSHDILTSSDGIKWIKSASGTSNPLFCVAQGNNTVAAGASGTVVCGTKPGSKALTVPALTSKDSVSSKLNNAVILYAGDPTTYVENARIDFAGPEPFTVKAGSADIPLVPAASVCDKIGANYVLSKTGMVTMTLGIRKVTVKLGGKSMQVNGKPVALSAAAQKVNGTVFVPLQCFSANGLGKEVLFEKGLIFISSIKNILDVSKDKDLIDDIIDQFKIDSIRASYHLITGLADAYLDKGDELYDLENYEEAIKLYDKAIALMPESLGYGYYSKGMALRRLEKYEEAIVCQDKAIQIYSEDVDAYQEKADILNYIDKYDEAISTIEKAIELDPDNASLYITRGNSEYFRDKDEEAIKYFDIAIQKDAKYAYAYYIKSSALAYLERTAESLENLKKAIELDPLLKQDAVESSAFEYLHNNAEFIALTGFTQLPDSIVNTFSNAEMLREPAFSGVKFSETSTTGNYAEDQKAFETCVNVLTAVIKGEISDNASALQVGVYENSPYLDGIAEVAELYNTAALNGTVADFTIASKQIAYAGQKDGLAKAVIIMMHNKVTFSNISVEADDYYVLVKDGDTWKYYAAMVPNR